MANANQFIGSRISLISKSEIRYEGILYALDIKEATISLAKVRAFGTEDRPTEHPATSKEEIYEFIIFRGSDIKCIDVLEPPKQSSTSHEGPPNDPAIVEVSHYHSRNQGPGSQSSVGRGGGTAGGSKITHSRPLSQNENVFEGLLRRGPRQTDTGTQVRRSLKRNDSLSNEERGQERSNGGRQDRRGGGGNRRGQGQAQAQGFQGRRPFNFSPRGVWGGRGSFRRPQGILRAPQSAKVTFDQDFDFEKSHEELLTKMKDVKVGTSLTESNNANIEVKSNDSEEQENKDPHIFYKKDEFFDAISCEALERTKGSMTRPDWRKELKINAETFGLSGQRRSFYQGGRGGFYSNYRGGFDNRWSYNSPRGNYNRYNNGQSRGSY